MSVWETARILPDFQGHSEMRPVSHDLSSSSDRLRNLFPTSRDQLPSSLSTILTHREASGEETDGRRGKKRNQQQKKKIKIKARRRSAGRPRSQPRARLSSQGAGGEQGGREQRCFLLPLPVRPPSSPASSEAAQAEPSDTHRMRLCPRSSPSPPRRRETPEAAPSAFQPGLPPRRLFVPSLRAAQAGGGSRREGREGSARAKLLAGRLPPRPGLTPALTCFSPPSLSLPGPWHRAAPGAAPRSHGGRAAGSANAALPLRAQQQPLRRAIPPGPALAHTPPHPRARSPSPPRHSIPRSHWLRRAGGAGIAMSLPLRLAWRGGARALGHASKPLLSRWRIKKKTTRYPSAKPRVKESAGPPASTESPKMGPNGQTNVFNAVAP